MKKQILSILIVNFCRIIFIYISINLFSFYRSGHVLGDANALKNGLSSYRKSLFVLRIDLISGKSFNKVEYFFGNGILIEKSSVRSKYLYQHGNIEIVFINDKVDLVTFKNLTFI